MSESFDIQASTGVYSVEIVAGALPRFLDLRNGSIILGDAFFEGHAALSSHPTIFREASEAIKSLDAAPALIEQLRLAGANRQTHLVALGGGVLQDLTAFIASIYMRGVPWTYIPTTVLAMVDSCIGGKSSINVGPYKNLVGTFHPPVTVLIDPALASTLPPDQQISGLIEAAKICFCRGPEAFQAYLACGPRPAMDTPALAQLIAHSLRAKKWFIEIDEFDKKERLLLNFGHTFGHAIEGASHFGIAHGLAVGLGILCALAFERQQGDICAAKSGVLLLEDHIEAMLHTIPELPAHLASLPLDEVLERFDSDKKHKRDSYTLILVDEAGRIALRSVSRSDATRDRIRRAVLTVIESYCS